MNLVAQLLACLLFLLMAACATRRPRPPEPASWSCATPRKPAMTPATRAWPRPAAGAPMRLPPRSSACLWPRSTRPATGARSKPLLPVPAHTPWPSPPTTPATCPEFAANLKRAHPQRQRARGRPQQHRAGDRRGVVRLRGRSHGRRRVRPPPAHRHRTRWPSDADGVALLIRGRDPRTATPDCSDSTCRRIHPSLARLGPHQPSTGSAMTMRSLLLAPFLLATVGACASSGGTAAVTLGQPIQMSPGQRIAARWGDLALRRSRGRLALPARCAMHPRRRCGRGVRVRRSGGQPARRPSTPTRRPPRRSANGNCACWPWNSARRPRPPCRSIRALITRPDRREPQPHAPPAFACTPLRRPSP